MQNENILIVEDNEMNTKLLRLLLTNEGYQVKTAKSAGDALEQLRSFLPDAVLMDIQLPDISGFQLTRILRQDWRTQHIRIVGVSANAMRQSIEEAYAAGCDGYITKPIDTRTFVSTLQKHLSGTAEPVIPKRLKEEDMTELRLSFTTDCKAHIERLLENPAGYLDRQGVRDVLHRCAGMAGTFGYPYVTTAARELGLVHNSPQWSKEKHNTGFRQLLEMLDEVQAGAVV